MNRAIKRVRIPLLLIAILLFQNCRHEIKSYEDELGVINNPRMYQKLVEDFPEKKLVDLEAFIPGLSFDIRYATRNNFTRHRIYSSAKAFLRQPAAESLKEVQKELTAKGIGLKIYDAYRPYDATLRFYKIYPDTNYVAPPWNGSRHNRGCAVDVSLIDLNTREELPMPTEFDDFSEKAGFNYMNLPDTVLHNRSLLKQTMEKNGFSSYEYEWWHYDFDGWENFELMNIDFKDLL